MPRGRKRQTDSTSSPEFLTWALNGLEREIEETRTRLTTLTEQASRLRRQVGGGSGRAAAAPPAANTAAAQSGQPASGDQAPARRRKRTHRLSAEARKKLSERMRKRWVEYRKQKGKNA